MKKETLQLQKIQENFLNEELTLAECFIKKNSRHASYESLRAYFNEYYPNKTDFQLNILVEKVLGYTPDITIKREDSFKLDSPIPRCITSSGGLKSQNAAIDEAAREILYLLVVKGFLTQDEFKTLFSGLNAIQESHTNVIGVSKYSSNYATPVKNILLGYGVRGHKNTFEYQLNRPITAMSAIMLVEAVDKLEFNSHPQAFGCFFKPKNDKKGLRLWGALHEKYQPAVRFDL